MAKRQGASRSALATAALMGAVVGGVAVWVAGDLLRAGSVAPASPALAALEAPPAVEGTTAEEPEERAGASRDPRSPDFVWDTETLAKAVAIDAARRRAYHLGRVEVHSYAVVDVAERAMRMARNGQRMRPSERRELALHYRNAIDSASPEVKRALGEVYSLSQLERSDPGSVSDEEWSAARDRVERKLTQARREVERAAPVELSMLER